MRSPTDRFSRFGNVRGPCDSALHVDPIDPDAIADAMHRIAEDGGLRQRLSESGRSRAATFSWRKCADETVEVYRDLVGGA
jgi:alpha-1,3-rhamnosyl/mannosyltransferase